MTRPVLVIVFWACVFSGAAGSGQVFRSSVSGVTLDVLAFEGRTPIDHLTADDFEVLDNGVPQTITSISVEERPIDVYFTFDRSASVAGDVLRELKDAATSALRHLRSQDRVSMMTFNHSFVLTPWLAATDISVRSLIGSLIPVGSTSLFDAMYATLCSVGTPDRRALVLVFSDGADNLSWITAKELVEMAKESEAVMYVVALRLVHEEKTDDLDVLREMSAVSGGQLFFAQSPTQLNGAFESVMSQMRARYSLTYLPTSTALGWHSISVRLTHRKGRVNARRGYRVTAR